MGKGGQSKTMGRHIRKEEREAVHGWVRRKERDMEHVVGKLEKTKGLKGGKIHVKNIYQGRRKREKKTCGWVGRKGGKENKDCGGLGRERGWEDNRTR